MEGLNPVSAPTLAPGGSVDFIRTATTPPHPDRAKRILKNHPEIRGLIGRTPASFVLIVTVVAAQIGAAWLLRSASWWVIVPAAAVLGAMANHALWVLIHECTHNLVFRRAWANTLAGILANLPHGVPTSVLFQRYHMKHHTHLGMYDFDADLANVWEAKLVGTSPWRKAIWLMLFAVVQTTRPPRLRVLRPIDRWVVLNFVGQLVFDAVIWVTLGPKALAYLVISLFFSVGLHPLGARWIQEHYTLFQGQETNSYYGPLNAVALNIGYHNEHHDFPSVPWNRLPAVRRAAPEAYEMLQSVQSWPGLLWQFIIDRRISLFSRSVRPNRADPLRAFDGNDLLP